MACTSPSYGSYVSAVNKNTLPASVKDTNRWQQPPPHLSSSSHPSSPFNPPPGHFPPHSSLAAQKQHSNQHSTTMNNTHGTSSSSNSGNTTATPTTTPTGIMSSLHGSGGGSNTNNGTSSQSSDDRNYSNSSTSSNTASPSSLDRSNPYHRHHRSATEPSPSKGVPFPGIGTGTGSFKQEYDGGWSQGAPTKGSGWRGSKAGSAMSSLPSPRTGLDGGSIGASSVDGWNGLQDTGTSGWEGSVKGSAHERRGSSGSGWLPMSEGRSGLGTPSADNEGWESMSSGQPSLGGSRNLWNNQCEIIDEDTSIGSSTSSGTLTSLPTDSKGGKRENGKYPSLPRSMSWAEPGGDRKLSVEGNSQEHPGRSDERQFSGSRLDERQMIQQQQQQQHSGVDISVSTSSSQTEEGVVLLSQGRSSSKLEPGRMDWEDVDRVSISSSEREPFGSSAYSGSGGHSQESQGPSLSSGPPAGGPFPHPDSLSVAPHGNDAQGSGRNAFTSHSQDGHVSGSDDSESFGGFHVSPRNGAGTPVQGRHSGTATPTHGRGNRGKGESSSTTSGEGNCWHGRRLNLGNTSSSSNGIVGTGWKMESGRGAGGNSYQNRSTSPRKPSRYERSNSTSLSYHDSTSSNDNNNGTSSMGSHTSSSSSSSTSGNSMGMAKTRSKGKKSVPDLGEGLDTLHNEPSGWGELPSPKDTDPDNGTEFWGIPPEDLKRQQMKEKTARVSQQGSHSGDSHVWGDVAMGSGGSEWEDDSPSGGWFSHPEGGHVLTPGTPGSSMMGGNMGYTDGRGMAPPTPRSGPMGMMDSGSNAWGSFPHKNKKPPNEKLLKPSRSDFDMGVGLTPDDIGGPSSIVSTPAGDGNLYVKDRLPHMGSKVPTTLGIGPSSFDLTGGVSSLNLSQDGSSMHQLNAMTPSSGSSAQSQARGLQLLQLQQQYLLNHIQMSGSVPVPSLPLNLQNYQQVLNQQLGHFQKQQQHLVQQAKMASSMGGGGVSGSQHHQISLKLKQTQQAIQQINHQLALIGQLSSSPSTGLQPKDPSPKSQDIGSFGSAHLPQGGSGMKHTGRSHSTSSVVPMDDMHEAKNLMFGLQGLNIGSGSGGYSGSTGGPSSRSTSRLHQIISGSSGSNESLVGGGGSQGSMSSGGGSQGSSPFSPPLGGSGMSSYPNGSEVPSSSSAFGSAANTPSNSAPSPFGGKFNEIQEFKPGVPWQPRNQNTEQSSSAQHLSKHPLSGRMNDAYAQSPGSYGPSSPVVDLGSSSGGMGFSSRSFQGGTGMPHRYGRSNSMGGGLYRGTSGNGGGGYLGGGNSGNNFGKKQVASPVIVNKYSIHCGSGNAQRSDMHQGVGSSGGWGNMMPSQDISGAAATSPFGNAGGSHTQSRSYYPSRASQGNSQSPVNVIGQSSTWKLQNQQQQQQQQQFTAPSVGSRRMDPPSSLPPRAGGGSYGSKSIGGTPIGTFYGGSSILSSGSTFPSVSAEDKKWGGYPSTPGIGTPSSGMISNSIWGSGSSSSEEALSGHRSNWGSGRTTKDDQDSNRIWEMDVTSTNMAPSRPPGFAGNRVESTSSTSSSFEPAHSTTATVLDEQAGNATSSSSVTTPSFTSGSSTWGQEEPHKEVFSPEPSFTEWRAGKKASLSFPKGPSNMASSPWLIMHNVTSQVNQTTVKEVCSEFGELKVCYIHRASEFCLICYTTTEEATQAKTALDKNSSINGVHVTVEFATEAGIKEICEHLQVRLDTDKQQQQQQQQGGDDKHKSWGFGAMTQQNSTQPKPSQWDGPSPQAPPTLSVPSPSPSSSLENSANACSKNTSSGNTGSLYNRQTSELSTPGSSVWSDPGFLSGFSSPWQSGFSSSGALSAGSGGNSGSFSLTSPQQGSAEASSFPNSNEPFLPNGLF